MSRRCSVYRAVAAERPQREHGFVSIFNGEELSGWDGRKDCWRVVDGAIEGAPESGDETPNSWLIWRDGTLRNFHLKLKFRIRSGNSGVFYRAVEVGDAGRGYQAEVATGPIGTGKLHHGGGKRGAHAAVGQFLINQNGAKGLLVGAVADTKWLVELPYYVPGEWTDCDIIARGNHIAQYVNGLPTVEFIDRDEKDAERTRRVDEGILALQLHRGHAMQVHFKDIRLKQFSNWHCAKVMPDSRSTGRRRPGLQFRFKTARSPCQATCPPSTATSCSFLTKAMQSCLGPRWSAGRIPHLPRHTSEPSLQLMKRLPLADAIPSKTGGDASSNSASVSPVALEQIIRWAPFRPS